MTQAAPSALVAFALALAAATPAGAQPAPGCDGEGPYAQFDFWVGEWDVYNPQGVFAGRNVITRTQNGCLIVEDWTGAQGGTGMSMNFYDPLTNAWRQVWVSPGAVIDYSGGLDETGRMVLEGEISYRANSLRAPFRGVWTPNDDGTVTQHFTQQDAESGEWRDWFVGTYRRAGP